MKNIVVTGAQGFVGSAVVNQLAKLGYNVIPMVRKTGGSFSNAIKWDISKPYDKGPTDVDVVVHTAAKVDDWGTYEEAYQVNVAGTQNVIKAFPSAKLFIYISSASVYDPKNTERTITEQSPAGTNLLNDYSRTKYEGERVVTDSSIPSRVVLRPHIIYGPGDRTVLPRLLKARRFGRFLILGNGKNQVSLTHIDNLVHSITSIIKADNTSGTEVFNIVDNKSDTVRSIVNELKQSLEINEKNLYIPMLVASSIGVVLERLFRLAQIKHSPLITPYIVEQMTSDHVIDCTKAVEAFGYHPMIDYKEGLKKLYHNDYEV